MQVQIVPKIYTCKPVTYVMVKMMLTIPVPGWTHHQAITPDGRYVISTHATRGYVSVVDLQSNTVIKTIKTGNGPNYTLVKDKGDYAYISNSASGTISEIDINKWAVTRVIEGGPSPYHLNTIHGTEKVYVSSKSKPIIWVIDGGTLKVLKIIKLPAGEAHQMAIIE